MLGAIPKISILLFLGRHYYYFTNGSFLLSCKEDCSTSTGTGTDLSPSSNFIMRVHAKRIRSICFSHAAVTVFDMRDRVVDTGSKDINIYFLRNHIAFALRFFVVLRFFRCAAYIRAVCSLSGSTSWKNYCYSLFYLIQVRCNS